MPLPILLVYVSIHTHVGHDVYVQHVYAHLWGEPRMEVTCICSGETEWLALGYTTLCAHKDICPEKSWILVEKDWESNS